MLQVRCIRLGLLDGLSSFPCSSSASRTVRRGESCAKSTRPRYSRLTSGLLQTVSLGDSDSYVYGLTLVSLFSTVADFYVQFTNWFVAMLTPILLDKSAFGAYFLFGGLALFTVAVLGACMPETRGRSLEEIQQAFHQPALESLSSRIRSLARRGDRATTRTPTPSSIPGDHEDIELRPSAVDHGSVTRRVSMVNPLNTMTRGLRIDAPVS